MNIIERIKNIFVKEPIPPEEPDFFKRRAVLLAYIHSKNLLKEEYLLKDHNPSIFSHRLAQLESLTDDELYDLCRWLETPDGWVTKGDRDIQMRCLLAFLDKYSKD